MIDMQKLEMRGENSEERLLRQQGATERELEVQLMHIKFG